MKIEPVRKIIENVTAQYGSVILLLGTRKGESASRTGRMQKREYNSRGLNPHHEIPNALVLSPIREWSTEQVWEYLMIHNPPPWGIRHDAMMELYRNANSGECPVITDLETPIPGRIALRVQKGSESKIILDETGAEKLLGFGDMIVKVDSSEAIRAHGAYISEDDINHCISNLKR